MGEGTYHVSNSTNHIGLLNGVRVRCHRPQQRQRQWDSEPPVASNCGYRGHIRLHGTGHGNQQQYNSGIYWTRQPGLLRIERTDLECGKTLLLPSAANQSLGRVLAVTDCHRIGSGRFQPRSASFRKRDRPQMVVVGHRRSKTRTCRQTNACNGGSGLTGLASLRTYDSSADSGQRACSSTRIRALMRHRSWCADRRCCTTATVRLALLVSLMTRAWSQPTLFTVCIRSGSLPSLSLP